ncbi:hypothetical protein HGRIS_005215 [Hohenbuehelia grisea]|uniref:BZIP domain-containing protein n=1 Tax=Hohenbuehelia grisea TaxID=104357 RepID=A0ABR3JEA6_9AGAR
MQSSKSSSKGNQATTSHRGHTRYKEKFQELREKYEQVNARREQYHHELALASAKIARLQAENDVLLDSLSAALPQNGPSINNYTTMPPHDMQPPPPEQYPRHHHQRMPSGPDSSRRTPLHQPSNGALSQREMLIDSHPSQTNGVVNGSTNGTPRRMPLAQEDLDVEMNSNDRSDNAS